MLESQLKKVARSAAAVANSQNLLLKENSTEYSRATKFAVGGYMLCSSLLLICNKLAVHNLPAPGIVLFGQLFFTALLCFILGTLNIGFKLEDSIYEWHKVKPYILVSCVFLATVFANIKTLQYCNVETFIVFRASTPLIISIGDYVFLGRELPSLHSWMCLIGLLLGSIVYALTDSFFDVSGYTFVAIWYAVFSVDQLFIKHVCNTVQMKNNWGKVYYTNMISCVPLMCVILYTGEVSTLKTVDNSFNAVVSFLVAMLLGFFMGYFAFLARTLLSAASFTIVGNVCKLLTVLINFVIWDKHANLTGIFSLLFCLFCAYQYKQAPMRKDYQMSLSKGDEENPLTQNHGSSMNNNEDSDDQLSDNAAHTH